MNDFVLRSRATLGHEGPQHCHCGRAKVHPSMMYDVCGLDATLRTQLGWDHVDHVCDGCVTHALRTGALTHEAWHAAHDAPAHILAHVRQFDLGARA